MSKIIGQIAHCSDCIWQNEAYWEARKKAYQHHRKTGHEVWYETTTASQYKRTAQEKDTTNE